MANVDTKSNLIDWGALTPVRNTTYSSRIVSAVRDALFARQLKPGDFLGSEKDVASKFGVSRMAARDAMRTLEAIGIIEIRVGAGGGARIASGNDELFADVLSIQLTLSGASAREIIETQRIIETTAARLAAEFATEDEIARIATTLKHSQDTIHDTEKFTQACLDFHLAIADASHNRVLKMQLTSLQYVVWPEHNRTLTPVVSANLQDIHEEIYQAIAAHDPQAAHDAMHRHLSGVRTRRMREYGETNEDVSQYDPSCC